MIELWENHWHCILPSMSILIALFVLWMKDKIDASQKTIKKNDDLSGGKQDGKESEKYE